ncbi:aminotransferase class I/II-fold pyridoxal phosphate-dependent enzyme [Aquipuribacter sp. SD81]|uniref:aminotransferase class I/II-fold pyridoxal phosphate-dependent enzyme n=1 Tax=Aquipuribacter sp. SD81 TaxID=3127703 RepID=UPI00301B53B0
MTSLSGPGPDLRSHGDTQVPPGALDLAVNVHPDPPPGLAERLARLDVVAYPDGARARALLAARHGVPVEHVLLVNGAAEAFHALAHGLRPSLAACVHPSFTAPEAALRAAGVPVLRVLRDARDGFALDPSTVPARADLVVLGRPDNPTGHVAPPDVLARLARPGRRLVVDEAFAEHAVDPLELDRLDRAAVPGLVRVRSLTKVWGVAGLRVGYVLAEPDVVARLAAVLQPWPVNVAALAVVEHLFGDGAERLEAERRLRVAAVDTARAALLAGLRDLPGSPVEVHAGPVNYVLLRHPSLDLRETLLAHGVAVRRCDTFPGLDRSWVRVAVHPDPSVGRRLLDGLAAVR